MSLTRAESTLPADLERLAEATIGICLTVHRELGADLRIALVVNFNVAVLKQGIRRVVV
jgi:hypothetical protein